MAVEQTGSTTTINASSQTGSQAVTVPGDANFAWISFSGWRNAQNYFPANPIQLNSVDADEIGKTDGAAINSSDVWSGKIDNPTTGDLDWDFGGTPTNGFVIHVTFFKNVDTSSSVKDSGTDADGSGTTGLTTSVTGLTQATGDMVVGVVGSAQNPDVTGSGQTGLSDVSFNNHFTDTGFELNDNEFFATGCQYPGLVVAIIAASTGVDNLTATGISATPVLGVPTIGQVHALNATGIAAGPVLDTPSLGQEHNLAATGIATGAPVVDTPTLGQAHALAATGIATTPVLGNPTIGQVHDLAAGGIALGAPVLGNPVLAEGVDSLVSAGIALGAPTLGTPTLAQVHALVAAGIVTGAPVLGTPVLAVNVDVLAATGIATTPVLGNPTLGQVHALIATGIATGAPALGTPVLVEAAAVGLATMTFSAKIPGMSIAAAQPSMGFASSQPRMEITDE